MGMPMMVAYLGSGNSVGGKPGPNPLNDTPPPVTGVMVPDPVVAISSPLLSETHILYLDFSSKLPLDKLD
jgi:hypothetical protein